MFEELPYGSGIRNQPPDLMEDFRFIYTVEAEFLEKQREKEQKNSDRAARKKRGK